MRYANGQLRLDETDLESTGFGLPWGHRRSFGNLYTGAGPNGYNWIIYQMPYLQFDQGEDSSDIVLSRGANDNQWFAPLLGGGYAPRFASRYQLLEVVSSSTIVVTTPTGIQEVYHDNSSAWPEGKRGRLKGMIDRFGHESDVVYNEYYQMLSFEWMDETTGSTLGYHYNYLLDGENIGFMSVARMTVNGVDVRRALFEYSVTGEISGNTGDLKRVTVENYDPQTGVWGIVRQTYYRCYKIDGGTGFVHGLKYRLGPEAYAQLVGAGFDPYTCTDEQLADYADLHLEYDADQRVSREKTRGGSMTFSFAYTFADPAPAFSAYNTWNSKTVETRPDGSKVIVYCNRALQTLLKKVRSADGTQKQFSYRTYQAAGWVLTHSSSAAVQSVVEPATPSQPLTVNLWANRGVIRQNTYFADTDTPTGAIKNYVSQRALKRGSAGTAKKKLSFAYHTQTTRGATIHPVWQRRNYPEANLPDDDAPTLSFGNVYYHEDGSLSGSPGLTAPVPHDANDVSDDIVIEQNDTTYNAAGDAIQTTNKQRFHDADPTRTGPLQDVDHEPKARVSYQAMWHDPINRLRVTANYGTNGSLTFVRPGVAPKRSEKILVRTQCYAADGKPAGSIGPTGIETHWYNDSAGRRIKLIENATPWGGCKKDERITEYVYTPDGLMKRLILRNSVTGDQITRWVYGTSLDDSLVARADLLRAKIYPMDDDDDYPLFAANHGNYGRTEYSYSRQGSAITMTDPNGTEHEYDYDQLGRLVQDRVTTLADGVDGTVRRISRAYEPRGKVSQITSHDDAEVGAGSILNQVTMKYDGFANLIEDAQSHSGAVNGSTPKVSYAYNNGTMNSTRRLSITYPSGPSWNYGYTYDPGDLNNCLSRVQSISGSFGHIASYEYMGLARHIRVGYNELGVSLSYLRQNGQPYGDAGDPYTGYDRFGRTVDMRWQKDEAGVVLDQFQYGFDAAGNRLWKKSLAAHGLTTTEANGQDEHYGYDRLFQVTEFERGNLNLSLTAVGGVPAQAESFRYDSTGNWLRYQAHGDGEVTLDQTRANNRDNQLVQLDGSSANLAYDKAGNATLIPATSEGEPPHAATVLVWDAWNRMVRISLPNTGGDIAMYSYDGLARRITSSVTASDYYYNDQWRPVEEWRSGAMTPYCQYVWGVRYRDDLILRRRDTGGSGTLDETVWVTHDYFNPTALLFYDGGAGAVVNERFGYTAFGIRRVMNSYFETIGASDYDWNFAFQGQFLDEESGFYNYGYRYYAPQFGRWHSRDPIKEEGGINLYAMVINNPINRYDKFGLKPSCCGLSDGLSGPPAPYDDEKQCCVDGKIYGLTEKMTIKVCFRPPNLPLSGLSHALGHDHCWAKADSLESGMGVQNAGVPGQGGAKGYPGVPTTMNDHTGQSLGADSICVDAEVLRCCILQELQLGQPAGPWIPLFHDCNGVVENKLKKCAGDWNKVYREYMNRNKAFQDFYNGFEASMRSYF